MIANTGLNYTYENTKIRTPLFLAACCGPVKAINVLLDYGARTQYFGTNTTPAHAAAAHGDVACMQAFVRPGFDINSRGAQESTLLHHATLGGIKMMKYILQLDGGTDLVNARNRIGLTPLHCISKKAGNLNYWRSQVELLLEHGADIYARDDGYYTPAHTFAYWGDSECLQVLIDAGFDLHTRGKCGQTILHCASWFREVMVAYLLGLSKGMEIIDDEDDHGITALDYASLAWVREVEEVLLSHNARRKSSDATQALGPATSCCDDIYPIGG